MSNYTTGNSRHAVCGGIFVDVVEEDIPRVQKLLAGIKGGWQKAVGSAISRAASAGKTEAKRAVTSEYAISQGTFLEYTKNINHFQRSSGGGLSVVFEFAGRVIPLIRFNTRVSSSGLVTTQVRRGGVQETLNHAFRATMYSHTGIYERIGAPRFPVREFYGPATPQMMYSNEAVLDKVEEKMVEVYEKRIDHEILRLMNGW